MQRRRPVSQSDGANHLNKHKETFSVLGYHSKTNIPSGKECLQQSANVASMLCSPVSSRVETVAVGGGGDGQPSVWGARKCSVGTELQCSDGTR